MIDPGRVAAQWLRQIVRAFVPKADVRYTGIFLDPMNQQRLVKRFGQKFPQLQAHHMTLWSVMDESGGPDLESLPLGKTVDLRVVGYAEDDKGQAVVVAPPAGFRPGRGRLPHITISTAPGVKPVYSNELLRHADIATGTFPKIEGKVGWWDGTRAHFDLPVTTT